jgi:hypothetical protein
MSKFFVKGFNGPYNQALWTIAGEEMFRDMIREHLVDVGRSERGAKIRASQICTQVRNHMETDYSMAYGLQVMRMRFKSCGFTLDATDDSVIVELEVYTECGHTVEACEARLDPGVSNFILSPHELAARCQEVRDLRPEEDTQSP